MRLCYGQGIYEPLKYRGYIKGKVTREYKIWLNMLRRCYCKKEQARNPTYTECTISENFKNFQYFSEWCNQQAEFKNEDWCLDKDILVTGNNVYSEDTCCFVPNAINVAFIWCKPDRGDCLVGVHFSKVYGKYIATIRRFGVKTTLGYFNNQDAAHETYKKAKEAYIKELAYFWEGKISRDVFNKMLSWRLPNSREVLFK